MIALVRIALSRPYTFVVLALLLLIIGPLAVLRTPTDIFPEIRIPVIGVAWSYNGLPPDQMSGRITTPFERTLTTTVNDIEHIVANSYNGIGIIKIFFQPNVDIRTANAQVTAIAQTLLKQLPPGATPPLILNYSASTVPIIQVALSGDGLTEQNLADIGINQLRTPLVTVPGAAIPYPYGGKQRQVQIDLNSTALQARGLSGQDVANALAAQNLITPVGTQKIGNFEYTINLNNSPLRIEELGDLPVKTVNGAMVYVRDVATVRDGNPPQTNIVHVDGNRSVLMMVLKAGATSTLDIISGIKRKVIEVKDQMPDALKVGFIGDQSVFVRGAIQGVAFEGVIARSGAYRRFIHFDFVYSSACPCSAELAEHARHRRGVYAIPHSQRSKARITLEEAPGRKIWIEDVQAHCLAALKTETQVMVKREDEQAFAELNGANIKFVEDAARLLYREFDRDPRVCDFQIACSHLESLHSHDAVSVICKGVKGGLAADFYDFRSLVC